MVAKFGNKEIELKFTFKSFKYMGDFNIADLADIEYKPFKIATIASTLLLGAANNGSVMVAPSEVDRYLEECIENDTLSELVEELVKLLEESNFFKALQKK